MKTTAFISASILAWCLISCNGTGSTGADKPKQFPKPGTLIDSASMPVTNDPLNHFRFSVRVIADSAVASGVYDVDADYGPNFNEGALTMPKGGEDLKPAIRKGDAPYTYIIGFHMPGDTTFYDYFEVSSTGKATKMQYIKAYTF